MHSTWRLIASLAFVAAVSGCAADARTSERAIFEHRLPGGEFTLATKLVVIDGSGVIRAVEDWSDEAAFGVTFAGADPNALVVTWLGGMCDHQTTLTIRTERNGWIITEKTSRADGCLFAGITRSIVLRLSHGVPPHTVRFVSGDR